MVLARLQIPTVTRGFLGALILFLLQLIFLPPCAFALQSYAGAPQPDSVAPTAGLGQSLRPALQQVGDAVSQIHVDHWKVSKSWKAQLQSDADSIAQDLSHQLPALLQQADASPKALDVQLRAIQNVDALYDVLVRLTMAADLTEKKSDAAMLDSALDRLEADRKSATGQMVRAAVLENQQLIEMRARIEEIPSGETVAGPHAKTIVIDNEARHGTRRRATRRRKTAHPPANTNSGSKVAQPSAQKATPQH